MKTKSARLCLCVFASLIIDTNLKASILDWNNLGWNTATPDAQSFFNVGGSGVNAKVSYSSNMWDGTPGFYDPAAPHWNGDPFSTGNLRFTNDSISPLVPTTLTIEFSSSVYLDNFTIGGLSIIGTKGQARQEQVTIFARDQNGALVPAALYDVNSPLLALLDSNTSDRMYSTRGLGLQNDAEFGLAKFSYGNQAVNSLHLVFETFEPGTNTYHNGLASNWLGDIQFTPVPEPGSALLIMAALASNMVMRRRRPHQHS